MGIATGFSITVGSWGVVAGPPFFGFIVDMSGSFISGWLFISFIDVAVECDVCETRRIQENKTFFLKK